MDRCPMNRARARLLAAEAAYEAAVLAGLDRACAAMAAVERHGRACEAGEFSRIRDALASIRALRSGQVVAPVRSMRLVVASNTPEAG